MKKVNFLFCFAVLLGFSGFAFSQTNDYLDSVNNFRATRERNARDPNNTFFCSKSRLANFKGLRWFPVYINYKVPAKFTVKPDEQYFDAPTFNRKPKMRIRKYGTVSFRLKEQDHTLGVYQIERLVNTEAGKTYLYIPFTDLTNADETYPGGRYLDFSTNNSEDAMLDFNIAYSPDCAYDKCNICPMPPRENSLPVRVEAGEKLYEKKDSSKDDKLGQLFFENYVDDPEKYSTFDLANCSAENAL